jgi:glycerol-3-phosphate acyltransferase PlsY
MSRLMLLMLLVLFVVVLARLVADGEWYLVGSLLLGIWSSREDIRRLFREEEKKD